MIISRAAVDKREFTSHAEGVDARRIEGLLRSGTAKSAVPPVGMTTFGSWMMREYLTSAKLNIPTTIDRGKTRSAGMQMADCGLQA
jgi:hypothetical protein